MKTQCIIFEILNERRNFFYCNIVQLNFVLRHKLFDLKLVKSIFNWFCDISDDDKKFDVHHRLGKHASQPTVSKFLLRINMVNDLPRFQGTIRLWSGFIYGSIKAKVVLFTHFWR